MTTNILVTGASGKTGRRLLPLLVAKSASVRMASRQPCEGYAYFDWADPDTFDPILKGVDAIYLVPPEMVEDASTAIADFLARAVDAGAKRVVLLSSLGLTFPNEPPESGRYRHERAVRDSGLDWTMLRPSGFFQNFSEGFMQPAIKQHGTIAAPVQDGAVSMVDAGDIAAVATTVLTDAGHANATYAITGPEALTFGAMAKAMTQASGRPIVFESISTETMAGFLRAGGVPDNYAAMLLRDLEAIRDGNAAIVSDTVQRVTGRPARPFAAFADETADAWR